MSPIQIKKIRTFDLTHHTNLRPMKRETFSFFGGLLLGAALGAAAVYLLDEENRQGLKDKAGDLSNKMAQDLADKLEDLKKKLEERL